MCLEQLHAQAWQCVCVCVVVISQTHGLVSQERLSLRVGTSVFIVYSGAI